MVHIDEFFVRILIDQKIFFSFQANLFQKIKQERNRYILSKYLFQHDDGGLMYVLSREIFILRECDGGHKLVKQLQQRLRVNYENASYTRIKQAIRCTFVIRKGVV